MGLSKTSCARLISSPVPIERLVQKIVGVTFSKAFDKMESDDIFMDKM